MTRCSLFNIREAFKGKIKHLCGSALSRPSSISEPLQNEVDVSQQQGDLASCESSIPICPSSKITTLPVELQLEIFENLDTADLISLRSTNKALRAVVQTNESYLIRQYIKPWPKDSVNRLHIPLERPNIRCVVDLEFKTRMADELSREIATGAIEDLLSSLTHWFLPGVKLMAIELLQAKFRTAILILFHYFEQYNRLKEIFGDDFKFQEEPGFALAMPLLANYTDSQLRLANQMCDLLLKTLSLPSIVNDSFDDGSRNKEPASKTMTAILKIWGVAQGSRLPNSRFSLQNLLVGAREFSSSLVARCRISRSSSRCSASKNRICKDLLSAFILPAGQEMVERGLVRNQNSIKHGVDFVEELLYGVD